MLKPPSHQSEKKSHILNIGRHIHIFLIDNIIDEYLFTNMIAVNKVSKYIDFLENEIMLLLHKAPQL